MTHTKLAQIQCRQDKKNSQHAHTYCLQKDNHITAVITLIFESVQGNYKVATVLWLGTDCAFKVETAD